MVATRERYVGALERAGAEVLIVEPGSTLPEDIDGLCISGGGDIAPERYGVSDDANVCENVQPDRDALEIDAVRGAMGRDLPVLGVCRGFQVINVAQGGKLVLDIKGHRPLGDDVVSHQVTPAAGSRLARACGEQPIRVNSRHHQAVTKAELASALRPTAFVDDLVEAFESDGHRWVVGVQWHPERTNEVDDAAVRIFAAFVAEASRSPIRA